MNSENFTFMNYDGKDVYVEINNDTIEAYNYYFEVWKNWNEFKILPHGKGTLYEFPWVLDIIKEFNKTNKEIELYYEKKRS